MATALVNCLQFGKYSTFLFNSTDITSLFLDVLGFVSLFQEIKNIAKRISIGELLESCTYFNQFYLMSHDYELIE